MYNTQSFNSTLNNLNESKYIVIRENDAVISNATVSKFTKIDVTPVAAD